MKKNGYTAALLAALLLTACNTESDQLDENAMLTTENEALKGEIEVLKNEQALPDADTKAVAPVETPAVDANSVPEAQVATSAPIVQPAEAITNTAPSRTEAKNAYIASFQYIDQFIDSAFEADTDAEFKGQLWNAYYAWDDELNKIYGLLKEKLPPQEMEALRIEQRAWIKERDAQTDPEIIGYLTQIELLSYLAEERTHELVDIYFAEE